MCMCTARTRTRMREIWSSHARGASIIRHSPCVAHSSNFTRASVQLASYFFSLAQIRAHSNFLSKIIKNVDESCYISFLCLQSINETKQE